MGKLNYYLPAFAAEGTEITDPLQVCVNKFLRIICQAKLSTPIPLMISRTGISPIPTLIKKTGYSMFRRVVSNDTIMLSEMERWKTFSYSSQFLDNELATPMNILLNADQTEELKIEIDDVERRIRLTYAEARAMSSIS